MKKIAILFCFTLFAICNLLAQKPIVLSADDNFVIVTAANPSSEELDAAHRLQSLLQQVLSKQYDIQTDAVFKGEHAITIGNNKLSAKLYKKHSSEIHDDGFMLHTDGRNLYLIGSRGLSDVYAVCHLMENYFGCTYSGPNGLHIEKNDGEVVLCMHDIQNPSFRYRETLHLIPNADPEYALWHKMHNRNDFNRDWGLFVHTFQHLVPAETYFDAHPEWFSLVNGRRVRDGQLCLSNPQVLEELCHNLEADIRAHPEMQYWSVSQNDNESSCTCPACLHLDSLYGGPSGTMLYFVNQVAARFPDKTISTLAYQQTRRPPHNIAPADNVNIMFCSIECQRQMPIADNPSDASFQRDMEGWTALTHNIFLWDYVVQFRNYMDPFPNLHVLQPNLQNFHSHGIPMIFEQGSGSNITENYEWRTFLIAHLMWNVNINVDSLRNRFLDVHYGENRSLYIRQYYDVMCKALQDSHQVLNIYGYPINAKDGYLSPDKIRYYRSLFADAYRENPAEDCTPAERKLFDDRLRLLELSLDFAILDLSISDLSPELTYFQRDADGSKRVRPEMVEMLNRFVADCNRLGVKRLDEIKYSPEQFYENVTNYIRKSTQSSLSAGRRVTCSTEWSNLYDVGGPKALTDGNMGMMNYNYNWLGFWGNDMDVVVDLDSVQDVHEVSADFLFYPLCWIFVPKQVICFLSDDGVSWSEVARRSYINDESLAECRIEGFHFPIVNRRARYVRMRAESLLTNPDWHRGVGQPCWIFCDEVIVK